MKKQIHPVTHAAIVCALAAMGDADSQAAIIFNNARSGATVNTTLTNYAVGIANDSADDLANFIAPIVATGAQNGQFKEFKSVDDFRAYETARALGGQNNRISFSADDQYFNCKPQGLEIAIDDAERDPAAAPLQLERAKVRTLVGNTNKGHAYRVYQLIKQAKAAAAGVGVWSDDEKDPIDEINDQIEAILNDTTLLPNRMVIGYSAWRVIKKHPLVRARVGDINKVKAVTLDMFKDMLDNPEIEVKISTTMLNTVKQGKAASLANVVGKEVFIFVGSDTPDQYDPSFAKTFMVDSQPIDSVTEYRDEKCNSDVFKTNWGEDIKVVSTKCGRRIIVS